MTQKKLERNISNTWKKYDFCQSVKLEFFLAQLLEFEPRQLFVRKGYPVF
jgi:hypothetical protein